MHTFNHFEMFFKLIKSKNKQRITRSKFIFGCKTDSKNKNSCSIIYMNDLKLKYFDSKGCSLEYDLS